VGDYNTHEGYDPRRRDEETAKTEEKKPEPKPAPEKHAPKKPEHA
jgi:hypothetical protein